jgi:shikimate kinase
MKHLVLIGMMGAGKSTVGNFLQKQTRRVLYDSDKLIEQREGMAIPEIFGRKGEAHFRKIEQEILFEITALPASIISTGGGAFITPQVRQRLQTKGIVFYLKADPKTLVDRVKGGGGRPLLENADRDLLATLTTLLAVREPYYSKADHIIPTDTLNVEEIGRLILAKFDQPY